MTIPALRWGVVGFGWVARDHAAPAMTASGQHLVAIADPAERARDQANARGAHWHHGIDEMIDAGDLDAIYVATPNHRHRDAVERAAAAGIAVLCEKPMAATVADADAIGAAVHAGAIAYRTAFDQRHHPAHVAIRTGLGHDAIGTVTAIRIVYCCWLGPDWSPDGAAHDNWRADPARAGGGALLDLAPHGIDLASFLLDEPIVAIDAALQRRVHAYDVDDGALLTARSRSGALVSLHVSYNHPDALPRRRLEIVGTDGMITAIDTMGQTAGGHATLQPLSGAPAPIRFDADLSPFTAQLAAFARDVARRPLDRVALDRDLAHHRLLVRAAEKANRCR